MRAGIYVRISQDSDGRGLGVARQEKDCRALVDRNGWTVAALYNDNDISAFSGKVRPGYKRLLDDLRAGHIDAIVTWHPDRLHRSPLELEGFIEIVERTGAAIATVTAGDLDLATPDGRMLARIVGSVARREVEHKSARQRRKHLELAEDGKIHGGGLRPYGYERDGVTVRDDEAAEVRKMVDGVLAGVSLRGIRADLEARAVPSARGGRWNPTTIKDMLVSARLSGQREHNGRIVGAAAWPAIITPEQTAALRSILLDPVRRTQRPARCNLVTGLLICGRCGEHMTSTTKGDTRRYECKKLDGCQKVGIDAAQTDAHVAEAMLRFLDGRDLDVAVGGAEGERAILADLAVLEERQAELAEEWAAGTLPRNAWQAARRKLDEQIADLRGRFVAGVRTAGLEANVAERWETLPFDRRRAIVEATVELVTIIPFVKSLGRFDRGRITITWRV